VRGKKRDRAYERVRTHAKTYFVLEVKQEGASAHGNMAVRECFHR
jgi:hypothetical protein